MRNKTQNCHEYGGCPFEVFLEILIPFPQINDFKLLPVSSVKNCQHLVVLMVNVNWLTEGRWFVWS